jgi:hypothetical protein
MANDAGKKREGLFIVDISGLGLSHEELLKVEKDINDAVMKHLQGNRAAAGAKFLRPPGPLMGLWEDR